MVKPACPVSSISSSPRTTPCFPLTMPPLSTWNLLAIGSPRAYRHAGPRAVGTARNPQRVRDVRSRGSRASLGRELAAFLVEAAELDLLRRRAADRLAVALDARAEAEEVDAALAQADAVRAAAALVGVVVVLPVVLPEADRTDLEAAALVQRRVTAARAGDQ